MKLPYRTRTAMGDVFEFEFPLHEATESAVRVEQLVTALLSAIEKDLAAAGETSNGDVLQAVAMALAIRARLIHAPSGTAERLTAKLLLTALDAVTESTRQEPAAGHA